MGTNKFNHEFYTAFVITMQREGWKSNDSVDPGGETFKGISRRHHPWWPGWKVIDQAKENGRYLKQCPELPAMAKQFYWEKFWCLFWGDDVAAICPRVSHELFDTAVNMGVHRAVLFLQESLNLLNASETIFQDIAEDGVMGTETLKTLRLYFDRRPMPLDQKEKLLLNVMNTLQGMMYVEMMRKRPSLERFRGWFLRV